MPAIGPLNVTTISLDLPGSTVAELATAVVPQAQVVGSSGSTFSSLIVRGALPVLVKGMRYSLPLSLLRLIEPIS